MTNTDQQILSDIYNEVMRAKRKHPGDFHNHHEAFAVLYEEVDEYWYETKMDGSNEAKRMELVQIAAMAFRAIKELC